MPSNLRLRLMNFCSARAIREVPAAGTFTEAIKLFKVGKTFSKFGIMVTVWVPFDTQANPSNYAQRKIFDHTVCRHECA